MVRLRGFVLWTAFAVAGCREEYDFVSSWSDGGSSSESSSASSQGDVPVPVPMPSGLDERPVVLAEPPTPPVMGGSIVVHSDGRTVFVSDPDRDVVHIVDLVDRRELSAIELPTGAQPWRAVEDRQGRMHVVLRGLGQIASFDRSTTSPSRTEVCPTPRGITLGPDDTSLLVACAGGELVEVATQDGAISRSVQVAPDLRDVVLDVDGTVYVTRFRSAEVLELDVDFRVVDVRKLDAWPRMTDSASMIPNTAWRMVGVPGGGWLLSHQAASDGVIETFPDQPAPPPYYGGEACSELVQSTLSLWTPQTGQLTLGGLPDLILPVDVSVASNGWHAVVVGAATCPPAPGDATGATTTCTHARVLLVDLREATATTGNCADSEPFDFDIAEPTAQLIAATHGPDDLVLVQQRDPARLLVIRREVAVQGTAYHSETIELSSRAIEDTGNRLFHEITASRLACASCHPEGGDDGLVWKLPDSRHTPALYVGLAGTAPFHWSGDLGDFTALVDEVFHERMGGLAQPPARRAAFENWVTWLRTAAPSDATAAMVDVGEALFSEHGCTSCHVGPTPATTASVVIGDLPPLQIPPLGAVGLHPPYMHDGRCANLTAAVRDMIVRTRPDAEVGDTSVEAIVAYLRTL